ncbi:hypothetical protein ALC62_10152 [Cyphomyrmex costatus]|uniref:Uncharacterized protein n=1 Tax=Cyphomyrmex costatus TaxID=456900 RepID=A0A195CGH2_9HYME|nr:hypothetical protein ALC62_10152 [Cyphomyrmex costatus]
MRVLVNSRSATMYFLLSSLSATIHRWPAVYSSGIPVRQILTAQGVARRRGRLGRIHKNVLRYRKLLPEAFVTKIRLSISEENTPSRSVDERGGNLSCLLNIFSRSTCMAHPFNLNPSAAQTGRIDRRRKTSPRVRSLGPPGHACEGPLGSLGHATNARRAFKIFRNYIYRAPTYGLSSFYERGKTPACSTECCPLKGTRLDTNGVISDRSGSPTVDDGLA